MVWARVDSSQISETHAIERFHDHWVSLLTQMSKSLLQLALVLLSQNVAGQSAVVSPPPPLASPSPPPPHFERLRPPHGF